MEDPARTAEVGRGTSPSPLAVALRVAAARCAEGCERMVVLYSGGLDSSIVAYLLRPIVPVALTVLGTEGSRDLASARFGAYLLNLPLTEIPVGASDVEDALRRFPDEFAGLSEPLRSVDLALAAAFAQARGPRLAVGQGADELFFGYAHFRGLSPEDAQRRAGHDWAILESQEWPRARRMATAFGLELVSPFLDPGVVEVARGLAPPASSEPAKAELRRVALEIGLPAPLANAPKRALQYGSGVHRLVRQMDRAAGPDPALRSGRL
jgi:asparagine synthase (glutamine-hydrolysing)